jgi:RNA polymerase sigma factor (sigma-70 family)
MRSPAFRPVVRHIRKLVGADPAAEPSDAELLQRFIANREEPAFAALVRRHGPLVWGVCWQVLHHRQDAEDAFQATLLLLARQAGSIRKTEAVAGWLYRVAHRVATKAGRNMARQRAQRCRVEQRPVSPPEAEAGWRELQAILNEELSCLPEKYRAPFILCCLEGQSGPEAAQQLGWKLGTVTGRLTEARKLLQRRLARRGVALSAVLTASAVGREGAVAASAALAEGAVQAALAGQVSVAAAALVQGMSPKLIVTKLTVATALLLAASLVAGAAALSQRETAQDDTAKPSVATSARPQAAKVHAADDKDSLVYGGRVLGPDGRPIAGAKLSLTMGGRLSADCVTSGVDGHFAFTVPKAKYGAAWTVVTATAATYGVGWVVVPADGKRDALTIRLVDDDVPITGQIVDLEAKPVAGATLRVQRIDAAPGEDLGPWFEAIREKKGPGSSLQKRYLGLSTIAVQAKVTTDAAGRLRLTGVGKNRLVRAQLDGPTIASQELDILTRPGQPLEVGELWVDARPVEATTYYGAAFRFVAEPTRPIVGVVRDKDTKQPLAGITIQSEKLANRPFSNTPSIQTTTDAQGRYRLTGMPKGKGNEILAVPGSDQPYLPVRAVAPDSSGLDPVTVDIEVKRAISIEGRLTDKRTGKPARGVVCYLALGSNPYVRDYPGYEPGPGVPTPNVGEDGRFRVTGLPGPGVLAVVGNGYYLTVLERDDGEGTRDLHTLTAPFRISTDGYNALVQVNPPKGTAVYRRDVTLDSGLTVTGTVVDPDGKPLAGTRAYRLVSRGGWERQALPTASFTVRALNPRQPRGIFFLHPERKLVGTLEPPGEKATPVRVRMSAGAAVTGRLVDADGQPRANVDLQFAFRSRARDLWASYLPDTIRTDPDGRFRLEPLLPGQQYYLSDGRGELYFGAGLRAGETRDLGNVQLKRPQ